MPLPIVDPKDWDSICKAIPPTSYLIDPILPANAKTLLHGPPGSGKSALAWGMAKAISLGEPYLGFSITKAKVFMVSTDMTIRELKHRWGEYYRPACQFMAIQPIDITKPSFRSSPVYTEFRAHVEKEGIELIVWDALGGLHLGHSARDDEVADMVDAALTDWFADKAVIVLGHDRKTRFGPAGDPLPPSNEDFLGSVKWRANATNQLHIWSQSRRMSILKHEKCQVGPIHEEEIKLHIGMWGQAELWSEARAKDVVGKLFAALKIPAIQKLEGREQDTAIATHYGVSDRTIRHWRSLANKSP